MAAVTVNDLKTDLKTYNYQVLTEGDDLIAARALHKATIWAEAKVIAAAGYFDPETEINREIVLKRAAYELYSYAENEAVAEEKKADAEELLIAVYGSRVASSGDTAAQAPSGTPSGAFRQGERNTSLF